MKKIKIYVCYFERIVMPSTIMTTYDNFNCMLQAFISFVLDSEKMYSVKMGWMLLWQRQVPFCYSLMFKKFLYLPNHSIRLCLKEKIINRGVGYEPEIPGEYMFYGNEKTIQWTKRTLDAVDGNVTKKF